MASQWIIDSHIHLWPESMTNEDGHAWMTKGNPLAKQHILPDYYNAIREDGPSLSSANLVEGVVYVETDVRYDQPHGDLTKWAKGPLDEIKFLRSIVEGEYGQRDSDMLRGIVAWAPMDQTPAVLEQWLALAEHTAGSKTWERVKGFRFLLQFIQDQDKFERLVHSTDFIENLRILGQRGFTFDVGVDQRSGGVWQLEQVYKAMRVTHEGVDNPEHKTVFIANHLCKPDFEANDEGFDRWKKAIEDLSKLDRTYMKLSGAFSELPDGLQSTQQIRDKMKPWVRHVLQSFGASRVMFGSDWPVCNVRGPLKGKSWIAWRDVVEGILDDNTYNLSAQDRAQIWRQTAQTAYHL